MDFFKKMILGGAGFAIGVILIVGTFFIVKAVAPGSVTNPTFGPQDDDVQAVGNVAILEIESQGGWIGGYNEYCDFNMVAGTSSCTNTARIQVVRADNASGWGSATSALLHSSLSREPHWEGRNYDPAISQWNAWAEIIGTDVVRFHLEWNSNAMPTPNAGFQARAATIVWGR